jgi:4-amino-4-deoxy-L-arabinose transferase-like glycosyltransferase
LITTRQAEDGTWGGPVWDRAALIALVLACLLRLAYAIEAIARIPVLRQPLADSIAYVTWAKAIAGGSLLQPDPFYRAPLYPYLIAPFYAVSGRPEVAIVWLQVLAGCAAVLLVRRIARDLYGAPAGFVAAVGMGFFGPLAAHETKILPTAFSILLEMLTLAQLLRARDARGRFAAGALGGLWALAQPSALLVLAGAVVLHARRGSLRSAALPIAIGGALLIAPATLHNLHAGDPVLISSNGGMTFYHGNNETSRFGLIEPSPRAGRGGNAVNQADLDIQTASAETGRRLTASESSRYWLGQGVRALAADPARSLRLWGSKIRRTCGAHDYADNYSHAVERDEVRTLRLFGIAFPALLIAAAGGLILRGPRGRREELLLLFAAIGVVTCVIFFVGSRYRCESVPALAILAGRAFGTLRGSSRRRRWAASLAAAGLLILAAIPPGVAASSQDSLAGAQWAAALERDGRAGDAVRVYRRAAGRDPTNAVAFARWADLEGVAKGPKAALLVYDQGIAGGADGPLLRRERGTARIATGDLAGAEADLRLVVRANPRDPAAALNLAACLVRKGADTEAGALLSVRGLDENPIALYYRGILDLRAGRPAQAAVRFDSSRAAGTADPRPVILGVLALVQQGRIEEGRAALRAWLEECGASDTADLEDRILARLQGKSASSSSVSSSEESIWKSVDAALAAIRPAWPPP